MQIRIKFKILLIIALAYIVSTHSFCQTDSLRKIRNKKVIFTTSVSSIAVGSLIYLNQIWYKPYKTSNFHFYNDNAEWLQMDKVGHSWTTYNTACLMMKAMENSGFNRKKSMIIGESIGFTYETAVEVMDGFSSGWGFSWGDMTANFTGAAMALSQQYFWNEQRIKLKYSFHQTSYLNASLVLLIYENERATNNLFLFSSLEFEISKKFNFLKKKQFKYASKIIIFIYQNFK